MLIYYYRNYVEPNYTRTSSRTAPAGYVRRGALRYPSRY